VLWIVTKTEAGTVQLFASPRNIFSSNKASTVALNSNNETIAQSNSTSDLQFNSNNRKTNDKFEPFQGGRHRGRRGDKNGKRFPPPPKSHHNRLWRHEEDNQPYTISIFTAIEILIILAYSLYLIYVGVSAYKLHILQKRQSSSARQAVPVSRPL